MTGLSQETRIELMVMKIEQLEGIVKGQGVRIAEMEEERNKGLKWGIIALGSMVIGMLTWGAKYLAEHLR